MDLFTIKNLRRLAVQSLLLLALCFFSNDLQACGGPYSYPIAKTLQSVDQLVANLISPADEYGDISTLPQFLFLFPYHLQSSKPLEDLWYLSYRDRLGLEDSTPYPLEEVSLENWERSLRQGDINQAEVEAKKIVDHLLNMPALEANDHQAILAKAVEFLEIKPRLPVVPQTTLDRFFLSPPAKDSLWPPPPSTIWGVLSLSLPLQEALIVRNASRQDAASLAQKFPLNARIATLRFIALQEKMHQEIPNGWYEDILKAVPPQTWKNLSELHDQWLKDFPQHPLADLLRFSELRIYYFQNDRNRAWNLLLDLYPRHQPRTLSEMRFLLQKEMGPENLQNPRLDNLLRSALLTSVSPTPNEWTQFWRISQQSLPQLWAVNFQERLLEQASHLASSGKALPTGFPDKALNPTPLWGQLRLLTLMKSGQWDAALEQAKSLPSNEGSDLLKGKLYLLRKEWIPAVSLKGLPLKAKQYLIRILFPPEALKTLCATGEKTLRQEACLSWAFQEAAKENWNSGADVLQNLDPNRAALFRQAAHLSMDTSPGGLLNWTKFLEDHAGKLFFSQDKTWYRSLNFRINALTPQEGQGPASDNDNPWTPQQETEAIKNYLTESSEMFLALKAYAAWLKNADFQDKEAGKVLAKADKTYNGLVNWDNVNSSFWQNYLGKSEWAETLRKAGKSIRAN